MDKDEKKQRIAYKWQPIEDLPKNWGVLPAPDLASLSDIWKEQSERLKLSPQWQTFLDRLKRKWSIETGIIEHIYEIDRGITEILIEQGIKEALIPHGASNKSPEEIVPIIEDHEEAINGLFDFVKSQRPLTTSYIKELHFLLTRHQVTTVGINGMGRKTDVKLIRGDWKKWPNNPTRPDGQIHEYCPPEQVASEVEKLICFHTEHDNVKVPPEVEAAWFHHRFTQIHPFMDGNGRVARALASLIFIKAGWFPLVVTRDDRVQYLDALEVADKGDLKSLVELFVSIQKKAFVKALSISEDVLTDSKKKVLDSVAQRLRARKEEFGIQRKGLEERAYILKKILGIELEKVVSEVEETIKEADPRYYAKMYKSMPEQWHWYKWQIVQIAREFDNYFANIGLHHSWARLVIHESQEVSFLVSIHALGTEFRGVGACSAFVFFKEYRQDEEEIADLKPACREIFQFTYKEDIEKLKKRFENWLADSITIGLDIWRKSL
ncbi:Fic family protein [bacterium]|nr:Fic family protein [bacterium]